LKALRVAKRNDFSPGFSVMPSLGNRIPSRFLLPPAGLLGPLSRDINRDFPGVPPHDKGPSALPSPPRAPKDQQNKHSPSSAHGQSANWPGVGRCRKPESDPKTGYFVPGCAVALVLDLHWWPGEDTLADGREPGWLSRFGFRFSVDGKVCHCVFILFRLFVLWPVVFELARPGLARRETNAEKKTRGLAQPIFGPSCRK